MSFSPPENSHHHPVAPVEAEESEWDFGFRPYLWMTGLNGTIGANGVTSPVDMVWASTMEARLGKWGVMLDFT